MKKHSKAERQALRHQLFEDLDAGRLTPPEAVRAMRAVTGLTQVDFAERVAGVSVAALQRIEQGRANPRVDTLERIGAAFGVKVGFVRAAQTLDK